MSADVSPQPQGPTSRNPIHQTAAIGATANRIVEEASLPGLEPEPDDEAEPEEKERAQQMLQLKADARKAVDSYVAAAPPQSLLADQREMLGLQIKKQIEFDDARGELGLGQQFARLAAGQHFHSIPGERRCLWVQYDPQAGIYRDAMNQARELAKLVIATTIDRARRNVRAASRRGIDDQIKAATKMLSAAQALQKAKVIAAILDVAKTDPLLRTDLRLFDRDPDVIVVQNGILDLRAGTLRPHAPENLVRKSAGTFYDAQAQCPRWERFLLQVMCDDSELVRYLQRAVGYTLTGHVREEVLFFMYGGGSNGKSVFANIMQRLMSNYYVRVSGNFLMMAPQANREAATPTMASIAGARIVMVNEVESGATLSGQQVKTLVSTEAISARPNYLDPFEFDPTHKVWVRGNHKPIVRDTDHGFWRRMHLIPFLMTIAKEDADLRLFDELVEELPGILRWAVDGARAWYADGRLMPAKAVAAATAEYQSDSDMVERWITDCCPRKEGAVVDAAVAYDSYRKWAEEENLKPMSRPALTRRLEDKGIACEKKRIVVGGAQVRAYVGLELRF